VACHAKGGGGGEGGVPALSLDALAPLTRTALYRTWLQGAVVLVILGAIDAGFSGDWSRTGVLTTGQEAQLRGLLTLLGFFHIGAATLPDAPPGHKHMPCREPCKLARKCWRSYALSEDAQALDFSQHMQKRMHCLQARSLDLLDVQRLRACLMLW